MKQFLAIAAITVASLTTGFAQTSTTVNAPGTIQRDPIKRNVPDGGTTVLLLGATLCGLYGISRKFAKA